MKKDIQECIAVYQAQLAQGDIRTAYVALTKLVAELKADFPKQYRTGALSFGYLDYTYFSFFNQYLRERKLRFGVVLNHSELRFELWLMGQNAEERMKYWELLKDSVWNPSRKGLPQYGVLEIDLEISVDFREKERLRENVLGRAVGLAEEIQRYLEGRAV